MTFNHTHTRNSNSMDEYDVIIPSGLGFNIGQSPSEEVEFVQYNWDDESGKHLSSELSYGLLFRHTGDVFLAIDGENLAGKPFDEVEALIMDKTKPFHHFRMRTSQKRAPVSPPRSVDPSSFEQVMQNLKDEIETHEEEIKSHKRAMAEHSVQLSKKKDEMKQAQRDELKKRKEGVAELKEELGLMNEGDGEGDGFIDTIAPEPLPAVRPRHSSRKRKPSSSSFYEESKRLKKDSGSWMNYIKSSVGL